MQASYLASREASLNMRELHGAVRIAFKRLSARQQFEQNDPERIEIAASIAVLSANLSGLL